MTNERPNILLIVSDQHRHDCLTTTSGGRVRTPTLDSLAGEGVLFEHAYCNIPTCCPARASLLSGKRPESFGALWNYDIGLPIPSLTPAVATWSHALASSGYRMAYLGKWHISQSHSPLDFGYGSWAGRVVASEGDDYEPYRAERHPQSVLPEGWWGGVDEVPLADTRTHWLAGLAIERIDELERRGGPWHLRLDFTEPHLPATPTAAFLERYHDPEPWPGFDDSLDGKPYVQMQQLVSWGIHDWTWAEWAPIVRRYFAIVEQLDDAIGLVLERARAARRPTFVCYTSDHGDMCGSHRMYDKHYVLYDDVVRVPLIVAGPGLSARGVRRDEFVYNTLDLGPTLLELAGLEAPADAHGRSLLPLLRSEPVLEWRDAVVATYNGQQCGLYSQRMIRDRDWKYVWNATDVDELYDLDADPWELENLTADPRYAEPLASLRRRLWEVLSAEGDGQVANYWVKRQLLDGEKLPLTATRTD